MTLFRTVEPAAEPLTLPDTKAHLRLAQASDDALLHGLIRAAREEVERDTGLALIAQSWRLAVDWIPADLWLPLRRYPLRAVTSVTVYGSEGEASVMDPGDYETDLASRPGRLQFLRRPERLRCMNGIEIDFTAGYDSADDVPQNLKQAMLMLVAHWYEFRASFGPNDQPVSRPAEYERLVAGYRMRRL